MSPSTPHSARIGRSHRILIYGHDSFGLGHLRRNLTLAEALVHSMPGASVLLVTGSPCATMFPLPERVEIVKLPSVTKNEAGGYTPRSLPGPLADVLHLRRRILFESYRVFQPDVVLVDHKVVGLHGEALDVLEDARRRGVRTILGIRDIIDTPSAVEVEWGTPECRWGLSEGYDRVCVYGDPAVFDSRREYPIPEELGERLEFVGYVVREFKRRSLSPIPATKPQVLVSMGGGEDGAERIGLFLDALELSRESTGGEAAFAATIVSGPLLDAATHRTLKRRARVLGDVDFHRVHNDLPRLLVESNAVVSMAGYNTCAEILKSRRPAVLLPRVFPRKEQWLRADRFERAGIAENAAAYGPEELVDAIERALDPARPLGAAPDLRGAQNMVAVVAELLEHGRVVPFALRKQDAAL
ncbi:MAG TPA: hypothetical protein ENJ09_03830 [Planctomycetes bacterium]|nr:hypothetical protein [Planctomycetota bacterium]